ncbi:hypothetical protein SCACP_08790 [Sporomusa carbonis]
MKVGAACESALVSHGSKPEVGSTCAVAAAIKTEWKEYIQKVNHIDLQELAAQIIRARKR